MKLARLAGLSHKDGKCVVTLKRGKEEICFAMTHRQAERMCKAVYDGIVIASFSNLLKQAAKTK